MPWNAQIFGAVRAALLDSAKRGEFVPHVWNERLESSGDGGGGRTFYGCGWGVVGWMTAVMIGGTNWAARAVPVGCSQGAINQVLLQSGVTVSEISHMDPLLTMQYFDERLYPAYLNRHQDPETFIDTSVELAEFFISVIARVPIDGSAETPHLPYNVLTLSPAEMANLPLFAHVCLDPVHQSDQGKVLTKV